MCDVCRAEGLDWKFANGKREDLHRVRLYRVYKDRVAVVELCHLHAIELFILGEQRFLKNHADLCIELSNDTARFSRVA